MATTSGLNERRTAIHLLRSGVSPTDVAKQLHRSLPWVYKWYGRFGAGQQWDGLNDMSRASRTHPNQLSQSERQAIVRARSELEAEAAQPGHLNYIGARAVQSRLKRQDVQRLPSISSIERTLAAAGMTRPHKPAPPPVIYPHLHPIYPLQLIQADIVPHFLPGGACVACFNAIDVASKYPTGKQYPTKRAGDAANFLIHVWQEIGISQYSQVDNEACFSGGFSHPAVLGTVVRLALLVGTELVFSPLRHPESNATVERFHQDYNAHVWHKVELSDLEHVHQHSATFFELYHQSGHHSALNGQSPAQVHRSHPGRRLPKAFTLPAKLPLTAGRVHFMRQVSQHRTIPVLNVNWDIPHAEPGQGVWATLEITLTGASLNVYDAPPDATKRTCLAKHPFPLSEPVQPLQPRFWPPAPGGRSQFSGLARGFYIPLTSSRVFRSLSTMR
jgi:transposase